MHRASGLSPLACRGKRLDFVDRILLKPVTSIERRTPHADVQRSAGAAAKAKRPCTKRRSVRTGLMEAPAHWTALQQSLLKYQSSLPGVLSCISHGALKNIFRAKSMRSEQTESLAVKANEVLTRRHAWICTMRTNRKSDAHHAATVHKRWRHVLNALQWIRADQVIRPCLHHLSAFGQVGGAVICAAVWIADGMRQLVFDKIRSES
jgi:hypothetical protein